MSEEVRSFSAVAYFFAKKIYEKNGIPIGLINASVGGTPIEAWTSENGFKEFPDILKTIQRNKDTMYANDLIRKNQDFESQHPKKTVDKGIASTLKWFDNDYKTENWRNINIPGYWEDQGVRNLNGTVWYRKEIDIPESMTGKKAKVFLGRIIDANTLYINGIKIAETTYQYPQRRYPIESGLLKPGKNNFVIKVTNYNNKGGFVPDKPYYLFAGKDTVDLKGTWQYKVGEVFETKAIPPFDRPINAQNQPTALYNAMIAPCTQLSFKGLLWYQGESNTGEPEKYGTLQEALIKDWRNQFQQQNIPFIYAQLPNFMGVNYSPEESKWAEIRAAQLQGLHQPNTAMTVNIDLGEWNDIHPDNKKDVGERMAIAATKLAYGEDVVYSGPQYQSFSVEENMMILSFSHLGTGLITKDQLAPQNFAIAGADKKWVWAEAKIEGNKVVIWNENIPNPKYARYAWADNPDNPNLYNKEGLPASPFTTE
ncbi:sialate O-acetylesterase [Maribacter spongiicola]|uniref:sialate O-acetylesterase n=1 Tax=Maribacter spongiicola TaxID=1206753 RepID=UPI003F9C4BE4